MRESAQRVLIEAHLSEGNVGEARRAFAVFRRLLLRDLGVPPSQALTGLLTAARVPLPVPADDLRVTSG
jgi:DNA-binding SARP family transcriptional activator